MSNRIEEATKLVMASRRVSQCYHAHSNKENPNQELISSLMYIQGECNLRAQILVDEERRELLGAIGKKFI